jgi:bifunctional pyridoxal-dependent enzyme with beta-cystathionase and maltose regulon repressor activities
MWPTVAAALRAYSHKKRTVVELIPVVTPFYRALDENQQQVARSLAQQLGLGSYAMLM